MIKKIKRFNFLRKCFGIIGAIGITLGVVDFKHVDALSTSIPTDSIIQSYLDNCSSIDEDSLMIPLDSTDIDDALSYINVNGTSNQLHNYIGTLTDTNYTIQLDCTDSYIIAFNNNENSEDLHSLTLYFHLDYHYTYTGYTTCFYSQELFDFVPSSTTKYYGFKFNSIITDFANTYGVYTNYNKFGDYDFYQQNCVFEFDLSNFSSVFDNNIYVYSYREIMALFTGAGLNYDSAYNQGYSRGSYDTIQNDYNGLTSQEIYNNGYNFGYTQGTTDTIANNYNGKTYNEIVQDTTDYIVSDDYNGKTYNQILQNGKDIGYQAGQQSVTSTSAVANSLFLGYAQAGFNILNGLFTPTLMGVPILSILLTFLALILVLWLLKKLL